MKNDLDAWLVDLASHPADRGLGDLEEQLGRDIALRRQQERAVRAMAPARVVALGIALALGALAGGTVAAAALRAEPAPGAFSAGSALAPSTLLGSIR